MPDVLQKSNQQEGTQQNANEKDQPFDHLVFIIFSYERINLLNQTIECRHSIIRMNLLR